MNKKKNCPDCKGTLTSPKSIFRKVGPPRGDTCYQRFLEEENKRLEEENCMLIKVLDGMKRRRQKAEQIERRKAI